MAIHRATFNRDEAEVRRLIGAGGTDTANEVEAAGCTPLHSAGETKTVAGLASVTRLESSIRHSLTD